MIFLLFYSLRRIKKEQEASRVKILIDKNCVISFTEGTKINKKINEYANGKFELKNIRK